MPGNGGYYFDFADLLPATRGTRSIFIYVPICDLNVKEFGWSAAEVWGWDVTRTRSLTSSSNTASLIDRLQNESEKPKNCKG